MKAIDEVINIMKCLQPNPYYSLIFKHLEQLKLYVELGEMVINDTLEYDNSIYRTPEANKLINQIKEQGK